MKIKIEFDLYKNQRNVAERGLALTLAHGFDFDTALINQDKRYDYGEARYQALGMIGERLHFLAFTLREDAIRVISLRKANTREVRFYEQQT